MPGYRCVPPEPASRMARHMMRIPIAPVTKARAAYTAPDGSAAAPCNAKTLNAAQPKRSAAPKSMIPSAPLGHCNIQAMSNAVVERRGGNGFRLALYLPRVRSSEYKGVPLRRDTASSAKIELCEFNRNQMKGNL